MQPHTLLMSKVSFDAVATWELFSGFSFLLIGTLRPASQTSRIAVVLHTNLISLNLAYYVNPLFDVNNVDRRWWAWVFSTVFAGTIMLLWIFYVGFEISMLLVWFCGTANLSNIYLSPICFAESACFCE